MRAEHVLTTNGMGCFWCSCDTSRAHVLWSLNEHITEIAAEAAVGQSSPLVEVERVRQFAREEFRRVLSEGRDQEPMTLMQHWSAVGGWLDWWMRLVRRGDDPMMPDAMVAAATEASDDDPEGAGRG